MFNCLSFYCMYFTCIVYSLLLIRGILTHICLLYICLFVCTVSSGKTCPVNTSSSEVQLHNTRFVSPEKLSKPDLIFIPQSPDVHDLPEIIPNIEVTNLMSASIMIVSIGGVSFSFDVAFKKLHEIAAHSNQFKW